MDIILLCIGFSQTLFAMAMILTKRPIKIAYIILCALLLVYGLTFGLDILQHYGVIPTHRWFLSLSLRMLFAPLFFLYAKYITQDFSRFNKRDFYHAVPSCMLIVLFFIIKLIPENQSISDEMFYEKYEWLRKIYGWFFLSLVAYYSISSIRIVIRFKKQIVYNYSYSSFKNSLDWLLWMIIIFLIIILLVVVSSALYEQGKIDVKVYFFRHILELFHVYVISMWGFHQKQLISDSHSEQDMVTTEISGSEDLEIEELSSGKYVKSGLKSDIAKEYIENLIKYMNESEVWKDSELSIGKLADQTSISKHQLSEVLNEYLGKSFYVFVNEYRVEYAKQLLRSREFANWSIIAVGYECGFNSKTAFNNFFKKYTQQTPSEFKKSISETGLDSL